jgi:EF-P beta-lysylation protein EpmB
VAVRLGLASHPAQIGDRELSILSTKPPLVRARLERELPAWQAELRDAIRDGAELCAALGLPPELARAAGQSAGPFPCLVPASYLARIERGSPADPLLRQVLPATEEGELRDGFGSDPVGEATAAVVPGLLQKYPGRALMIVTAACPVHCRYCFRREFPYSDHAGGDTAWDSAIDALAADASIEEVILSGGDPLTVGDARLGRLVDSLRLRIHTRTPVMIPSRVTDALVAMLSESRLAPVVVLHANHANELDEAVAAAVDRLRRAGVMLLNQAVLLRGVNDTVDAQGDLSRRLVAIGVTPYYLHQLDRVRGAAHFEVPINRGREIIADLRRRLPGYAVPQYVQEVPGKLHKTVL